MKKLSIIMLLTSIIWAVTVPANIDRAKIDDGTGACDKFIRVNTTRDIVVADSSANEYTMWTQMQECLAYNPGLGFLQFVCRNFSVSGNLDVYQTDNLFTFALTDENVYGQDLGPARYPNSVASDDGTGNGPHISFPYLFPGPAWGGMGGQYELGGWFSSFWDAPVDLGPGDIHTHKNNGKQLPDGNILFVSVTDAYDILWRTYTSDLGTQLGGATLAPGPAYYWGFDINGGTAYVFYYDDSLNVYYKTSTDGITWSAEQSYNMVWPNPFTNNVIYWTQMAVTDAGNPILVFDVINGNDNTYPYEGKVYVSTASGQPCTEVGVTTAGAENFYPTIATGGNYVVALFGKARSGADSLTFWDIYYNYSEDNGATWSTPRNLTSGITDHNNCLWQIAKRLDTAGDGQFFFVFGCAISKPELDLYYNITHNGDPRASRWYVGRNPVVGIAENRTETPKKLSLNIAPNPVRENAAINYVLPKAGNVSVQLYSADGRLVKTLDQGYRSAGVYTAGLNAQELANGAYVVVVKTDKQNITGKLVIAH